MSKLDLEQIEFWINIANESLAQTEADFQNGFYEKENIPIQSVHTGTALSYASLARAKFLRGDPIIDVRLEFTNAARSIMKSFTMAYDSSDPDYQGEEANLSFVTETDFIEGMNYALMANNFELFSEFAGWFQDPPNGNLMDPDVNRYAHALACTAQNRLKDAAPFIAAQFEDYSKKPPKSEGDKHYYTLISSLSAILNQNEEQFNQGLMNQLKLYQGEAKGECKDTPKEFICDYAVALANLGLHHGLKVTAEYPTLPQGLLIKQN